MASTGVTFPGSAENNTSWSGNSWASATNILIDDTSEAAGGISSGIGSYTNRLVGYNFGFNIPDSSIDGIEYSLYASTTAISNITQIQYILDIGERSSSSTWAGLADTQYVYVGNAPSNGVYTAGTSSDNLNYVSDYTDINNSTFGTSFRVYGFGSATWFWSGGVDYVTLNIYYTPNASVAVSGTIDGADESDIQTGSTTLILTLTGQTWNNPLTTTDKENILWGISGNFAFDISSISSSNVVRTSDTVVTITVPQNTDYRIPWGYAETVTVTVPASTNTSSSDLGDTFVINGESYEDLVPSSIVSQDYCSGAYTDIDEGRTPDSSWITFDPSNP